MLLHIINIQLSAYVISPVPSLRYEKLQLKPFLIMAALTVIIFQANTWHKKLPNK
jgi:hypothetical protein